MGPDDSQDVIISAGDLGEFTLSTFETPSLSPFRSNAELGLDADGDIIPAASLEGEATIANPNNVEAIANWLSNDTLYGTISTFNSLEYRIDMIRQIKLMSDEEKREMLNLLLEAFNETEEPKEVMTKVNRLKRIVGASKNSAS